MPKRRGIHPLSKLALFILLVSGIAAVTVGIITSIEATAEKEPYVSYP